jgi:hypothetical protein
VVLLRSAPPPIATLKLPVVSAASALVPTAVLLNPVVAVSALFPTAVFESLSQLLGHCALIGDESANQASPIASVKKPQRKGERLTDLVRVFIFGLFHWKLPC